MTSVNSGTFSILLVYAEGTSFSVNSDMSSGGQVILFIVEESVATCYVSGFSSVMVIKSVDVDGFFVATYNAFVMSVATCKSGLFVFLPAPASVGTDLLAQLVLPSQLHLLPHVVEN